MFEHQSPVVTFALRAIAAGAGGRALAQWALEEVEREQAAYERHQSEMEALFRSMEHPS